MYLNKAIDTIANLYKLQVETGERISVELVSGPGIGKSASMKQIKAKIMRRMALEEFNIKPFFLSTVEQPDVRGFGIPSEDKKTMHYTLAPWMPRKDEPEHGIVFLDEFRQAGHDVQKPAAELLLNGEVGGSKLPITYMVIAASNRESDRSGVQHELAFITNRRIQIEIEPHLDSWVTWAESNDVPWEAVAFAKHMPGQIFRDTVPKDPGPFCTPRSFVQASRLLQAFDTETFVELASGAIGEGTAAEFVAFLRVARDLPKFEEIIASPKSCRVPAEDRPDAQWATTQMLAHRVDGTNADKVFDYLTRLPKEFQVSGIRAAMTKSGPSLVQSKKFSSWLRENQDLLVAANLVSSS